MWPFNKTQQAIEPVLSLDDTPTLKQQVIEFWSWFSEHAQRFYETIENKRCSDLEPEVSEAVDRWLDGMAWVFGPGANKQGHSFTLSGEGVLAKQFLAEYWLKQAPQLPGWTFYSSRQPTDGDPRRFKLRLDDGNEEFNPIEFWISPYVNDQTENIDISVWHPSIHRLPEQTRFTALFLILDELLGEHGTVNWIGEIKFSESQLQQSMPITEICDLIAETEDKYEWKKYPPTEVYSSYQLKEPIDECQRGDTIAGTSCFFSLIGDYLDAKGPCEHPTPGLGVDYIFVPIETSFFRKGKEVNDRSKIEDGIIARLEAEASGISIGGATGFAYCYIDFAIYDGAHSLDIIRHVLQKHRVPKSTTIHFFTQDRTGRTIPVW